MHILAHGRRPHGNSDDLAEAPCVGVDAVGGKPGKVDTEHLEEVHVEGEEDDVEGEDDGGEEDGAPAEFGDEGAGVGVGCC